MKLWILEKAPSSKFCSFARDETFFGIWMISGCALYKWNSLIYYEKVSQLVYLVVYWLIGEQIFKRDNKQIEYSQSSEEFFYSLIFDKINLKNSNSLISQNQLN